MNNWKLLVPVCVLLVAGCAGPSGTETDGEYGDDGSGVGTSGVDGGADGSAIPIGDDRDTIVMNERIVYFAFDSSEVDDASVQLLRQHGRYLADNPGEKVRLEGHADERGSREYNIGLGERRSVAVQSVLLAQGASAGQQSTVSFGEERPANSASNENAWAQNRRVEIVYER
ncbi:MAG: peptidoglycan-associated lipoprotein Pal [Gammaproteobacteria bacterium]|jgi:peptidoglycan-associated lipoprotein|nr:peptidoglycan-associated lipoprotein Pal [Gammaproteobacteria bacterium]MDP6616494.1 peptidoglycan-associated lipoprotein Pal [Gammaproteobacteria bacterium]MDP6694257.1 peptidoglycan-associated lipoprotein Pal [Gammaproteobacteria bacterium]MDP7041505.1 peptidoglycan-associated lipoprotein Pal [Gammaproteobacteria bacterium]